MRKADFPLRVWSAFLWAALILQAPCFGLSVSDEGEQERPAHFGIEGGYFKCEAPEGWQQEVMDMPDYMISELVLLGPRVENVPVTIAIFYYAEGNLSFQNLTAFVAQEMSAKARKDEPPTISSKTKIQGKETFVFEKEYREYLLSPDPAADDTVLLKRKRYVLSGKGGKGFFVIEYAAPQSVFGEHLPVFERTVRSFRIV